ncbi:MAG: sensor histidine kinase, partial [Candidatus Promineifilaceae bacterium]
VSDNILVANHVAQERSEKLRRSAILAWLPAVLCLVGSLAGLVIWVVQLTGRATPSEWADALGWRLLLPVFFSVVAALIISRQPRNLVGWLLMIPALTSAVPLPSAAYLDNPPANPGLLFLLFAWFSTWNWVPLIFPIILIPLNFPDGKPPTPRWRWVNYLGLFLALFFIFIVATVATLGEYFAGEIMNILWPVSIPAGFNPASWEAYFMPVWGLAMISLVLLSTSSLIVRYRRAGAVERTQIKWLLYAAGLFTIVFAVGFFIMGIQDQGGVWSSMVLLLALLGIPTAIGIAILRYNLFDIDLVINRTLVYGGLTLTVLGIYVAVVGYLSYLFQTEANLAISLTATGVVAVLFGRLRGWLQRGVNRLMYGQRDEPYKVLTNLGEQLQMTLDPARTLQLMTDTIAGSLKLPYVAIHLQHNGQDRVAAAYGSAAYETKRFPLIHGGEEVGALEVAGRAITEPLTTADMALLNDLARQISPTVQATLLALDLEEARLRVVNAREESRRQLGSDLHDGVGHQLAGLARQVEEADKLLDDDPQVAQKALEAIRQQLNATSSEVRQLAYRLHPPELELLGLVGALQERAQVVTLPVVRLNIPQELPPLSAAVETAVYYIALEALTNVEKHAQAEHCTVRLALTDEDSMLSSRSLTLQIKDDGRGWAAKRGSGLGLLTMQGRAAEVGGSCLIEPAPEGGMQVIARLPLSGREM